MESLPWSITRKHQTNNSASKQAFGFVKEKRFKDKKLVLCDSLYNIPSTLGHAPSSGIGIGNKSDLVRTKQNIPSPFNYNIRSEFESLKRGVKFGYSRSQIKYNGIFQNSETPDPTHYNISDCFSRSKGFSMYKKIPIPEPLTVKNPGPGHYKSMQTLNSSGKYLLSNVTNCPGYKITNGRVYQKHSNNPGPGRYELKTQQIGAFGSYSNSKYENSRCRTFSKCQKADFIKKVVPGPGAYHLISEFGTKS